MIDFNYKLMNVNVLYFIAINKRFRINYFFEMDAKLFLLLGIAIITIITNN